MSYEVIKAISINHGNPGEKTHGQGNQVESNRRIIEKRIHGKYDITLEKTAGKWQKCNLVSGMASVASDMGWL